MTTWEVDLAGVSMSFIDNRQSEARMGPSVQEILNWTIYRLRLVAAAGPELAVDFTAGYVQVGRAPGDERRVITANDRARSFRIAPHGGPRGPKPST
jgi:hypothetical protein